MTTSPQIQAARDALAAHDNHTPLTGSDGFALIGSVERAEYIIEQIRPAIIGAETLLEQIANLIAGTKTGDVRDGDAVESIESLLYVFGVPIPERYTDDDMTDRLEELRVERFSAGDIVAHASDPGASFGVVKDGDETGATVIEHGSDTAWFDRQDIERIGTVKERLEELRIELRAERISYGELAELQGLAQFIDPSDTELLEAAGVPEFEDE